MLINLSKYHIFFKLVMIVIIRGHIRNSFNDRKLFHFIKNLTNAFKNLKIYIHTWNVNMNTLSWRKINVPKYKINKDIISSYFGHLSKHIKHIIIDDDTKIQLIGNKEGFVCKSAMPIEGWKNYWYGKFKIISYAKRAKLYSANEPVLNLRFDLFQNKMAQKFDINPGKVMRFIGRNQYRRDNRIIFMSNSFFCGIDNIYLGNIENIYKLSKLFHYHLDQIAVRFPLYKNQERLVHEIAIYLFGNRSLAMRAYLTNLLLK